MKLRLVVPLSLLMILVVTSFALAQNGATTPAATASPTEEATIALSQVQELSDMINQMANMHMSPDIMSAMHTMSSLMDALQKGTVSTNQLKVARDLLDHLLNQNAMPMPDDMTSHLKQMRDIVDAMIQNPQMQETPSQPSQQSDMGNMNMGGMMDATAQPSSNDGMGNMDMGNSSSSNGHMQAVSSQGVPQATQTTGGQPLAYKLVDGVKVFELTAEPILWPILPNVTVTAWTYNGTVPGPMIRVTEGDRVRIVLKNALPEATTIHWHGIEVPNAMDGVPGVTQDAVEPGQSFTYEFVAKQAGTYMYHSHANGDTQVGLGLYAPFIVDPAKPVEPTADVDVSLMLSEWRVVDGQTFPAMPMAGAEPNYFTINGKSFPATETINVKLGQRVRLRIANIGQFVHPMHLHGFSFKVVATDGHPVPEAAQLTKDTISVAPGERYDIEFVANEPGMWMLHCHILHHTTNDNVEPGGLMMMFNVQA